MKEKWRSGVAANINLIKMPTIQLETLPLYRISLLTALLLSAASCSLWFSFKNLVKDWIAKLESCHWSFVVLSKSRHCQNRVNK